jgi:hypothetical protein
VNILVFFPYLGFDFGQVSFLLVVGDGLSSLLIGIFAFCKSSIIHFSTP